MVFARLYLLLRRLVSLALAHRTVCMTASR
jgi:hypothetical protein